MQYHHCEFYPAGVNFAIILMKKLLDKISEGGGVVLVLSIKSFEYCTFDLNLLSGPWISFFCFAPIKTIIVGQIKILRSPTWGIPR